MHAKSNGYVTGFAEGSVLCSVMALAEVVNTIAMRVTSETRNDHPPKDSQITNCNVSRCRRVIRRHTYKPAGLIACLC